MLDKMKEDKDINKLFTTLEDTAGISISDDTRKSFYKQFLHLYERQSTLLLVPVGNLVRDLEAMEFKPVKDNTPNTNLVLLYTEYVKGRNPRENEPTILKFIVSSVLIGGR